MLNTGLPNALRKLGFTEVEVAHVMRQDGPLDDIRHRTWCETCKRSHEMTLRELLSLNAKCPCGGTFHIGEAGRDVVEEIAGRLVPAG
jgi:hypothetical protein